MNITGGLPRDRGCRVAATASVCPRASRCTEDAFAIAPVTTGPAANVNDAENFHFPVGCEAPSVIDMRRGPFGNGP